MYASTISLSPPLSHSHLWFLLVNHLNPSPCLEEKGQWDLNQSLKCLVMVGRKGTLITPHNTSHVWALRVSAEHILAVPRYPMMQIPKLLPCLCVGCLSICT